MMSPTAESRVTCSNCGAENRREARFCYRCHNPIVGAPSAPLSSPVETLHATSVQATSVQATSVQPQMDAAPASTAVEPPPQDDDTLIRRSASDTVKLTPVPSLAGGTQPLSLRPEFPPRPEGSFFAGRYEFEALLSQGDVLNTYRVVDSRPSLICPNATCELRGVARPAGDGWRCSLCGTTLIDAPQLRYLLKESQAADVLGREPEVAQRGLAHAALIAPTNYFAERLGPEVRHCVVVPEVPADRAAGLKPPQPLDAVLGWGLDLARGLAQLHTQRIAFAGVSDERIVITPRGAAWADFSACRLWPADTPPETMTADVSNDLRGLAAELFFLIAGTRSLPAGAADGASLTDAARNFFSRALPPGPGFSSAAEMIVALNALREPEPVPGINVDLSVGRATHAGMVRTLNEDSLMVMETVRMHESAARPLGLFVVADGMGGQQSGEVASRVALDAIARRAQADLLSGRQADGGAWIAAAAEAAHRAVAERREAVNSDMGSTVVMALVDGVTATVASIGDSRAYLVEASGEITQLTTDDSLVQRLVDSNQITADEARQHPKRSVILRALGAGTFQPPEIITRELFLGDRLLLCSDGLSAMLDDLMMAQIVTSSASPQEACGRLIEAANASGGEDNVSVIVVEVVSV